MSEPKVVAYTDGACKGNPGPGGWGVYMTAAGQEKSFSGAAANTTNNRMELQAAIEALLILKRRCDIAIYTDSTYVRDGITKWIHGWKRNGWKTAARKPVKNADQWRQLDTLCEQHQVQWNWVKGHAGDPGNERADLLASTAAASQRGV